MKTRYYEGNLVVAFFDYWHSHSTGLTYRGYSIQRREKWGTEKSYVTLRKPVVVSAASRCLQTV